MRVVQSFADLNYWEDPFNYYRSADLRPFWATVNDKNLIASELDDAILDWKNQAIETILRWKYPITRVQRTNIRFYKGLHNMSQEVFEALPYNRNRRYSKNHAQLVVNKLGLLTDQHVADMISYSPSVKVVPLNNQERDKVAARQSQGLLDFYDYRYKVALKWQKYHLRKKICGTTFLFVLWDDEIGDIHPSYVQFRQMREALGQNPHDPVPMLDPESGEVLKGQTGEPIFVDKAIRVGDAIVEHEFDERCIYEKPESGEWEDVDWIIRLKFMDVDEVKARWPDKADELEKDAQGTQISKSFPQYYPQPQGTLVPKICVRFMYHRPTRYLDRGYECASTETCLLEKSDYKYSHGQLPVVRGTDIDIPGEILGMSFYQNLIPLQYAINTQASMFLQDQITMTFPKIAVPRGAKVRYMELGDDRGIYEYSGVKPPEIINKNPTPQQSWQYYSLMSDELKMLSAVFGQSVGAPPSGITANVALRMLDEQEQKLRGPAVKKLENDVVLLNQLLMSIFGSYYDPSDGRLQRILGADDSYTISQFDVANLSSPYEVVIQKTSGLPKSPAAKVQTVLDFAERFPELWSSDEVLEMVDIARPEKLVESATIARQAAEAEVENILQGKFNLVPPPSAYDEILPKWKVYVKAAQGMNFKLGTPPDRQRRLLQQILTAEYLIYVKMKKNPAFMQLVLTECPNYPMLFPENRPDPNPYQLTLPSDMLAMQMGMGGPVNAPALAGMPPQAQQAGVAMPLPVQETSPQAPPSPQTPMPQQQLP